MLILVSVILLSVVFIAGLILWGKHVDKITKTDDSLDAAELFSEKRWPYTAKKINIINNANSNVAKAVFAHGEDGYDVLKLIPNPGESISKYQGLNERLRTLLGITDVDSAVIGNNVTYKLWYEEKRDTAEENLSEMYPWKPEYISDDIKNVPVGFDGRKNIVTTRADKHTLFIGQSGSGKSVLIWDLIGSLSSMPDVTIWGVDLKEGVEFRNNTTVFDRVISNKQEMVTMFYQLHKLMNDRLSYMTNVTRTRDIDSTPELTRLFVVIDEMASVAVAREEMNAKDRRKFQAVINEIFFKSRASGITIFCASQNWRKDYLLTGRENFQQKILGSMEKRDEQTEFLGRQSLDYADVSLWDAQSNKYSGRVIISSGGKTKVCKAFMPSDDDIVSMKKAPRRAGCHVYPGGLTDDDYEIDINSYDLNNTTSVFSSDNTIALPDATVEDQ